MHGLALVFAIILTFTAPIKGEDAKSLFVNPVSINIDVKPLNDDLIWTDEKDLVGAYLPDKAKKNGKATGFRDIILENVVQKVFKRIMEKIGNPEMYPPRERFGARDPWPLNERLSLNKSEDLFTIDMKTGQMAVGGFSGMEMDYIRVVRHFGLKDVKVSLRIRGDLRITGTYTLKGTAISILPVTGDGDFSIAINGADISAITYMIMNDKGETEEEKQKIIMKNLDAQVAYKELDFKFENLMGGGIVGSTVNLVINAMGEAIIESQRKMLIELITNKFHEIVDTLL